MRNQTPFLESVLKRLIDKRPFSVSIFNRTPEKADLLASRYPSLVRSVGWKELRDDYDLVINGTSVGVAAGEVYLPEKILKNAELSYDMVYSNEPTPFQSWCRSHSDSEAFDGLGMLVEQASEAFALWFGKCSECPLPKVDCCQINKCQDHDTLPTAHQSHPLLPIK